MKNKVLYISIILSLLLPSILYADVDPFSRSFTKQATGDQTSMSASPAAGDNSVHPMLRLSIDQYFIKGIVTSTKGSLAIVSFPGGDDYFLYIGDLIGNDEHKLKTISIDSVTLEKEGSDDVDKQVFNPVQTITGMDGQ
tara:strand:+ start:258 stop:674 length:417 start_codon:yes stop_codon:yes gene_type:complete